MARTGRPTTLPGFWGPLAAREGGVQRLARSLGVPERTLRHWATNERSMDAIVAAKIDEMELPADWFQVYLHPDGTRHVGHAPEGWVQWPAVPGGWAQRVAFKGPVADLLPGNRKAAREAGWPW